MWPCWIIVGCWQTVAWHLDGYIWAVSVYKEQSFAGFKNNFDRLSVERARTTSSLISTKISFDVDWMLFQCNLITFQTCKVDHVLVLGQTLGWTYQYLALVWDIIYMLIIKVLFVFLSIFVKHVESAANCEVFLCAIHLSAFYVIMFPYLTF